MCWATIKQQQQLVTHKSILLRVELTPQCLITTWRQFVNISESEARNNIVMLKLSNGQINWPYTPYRLFDIDEILLHREKTNTTICVYNTIPFKPSHVPQLGDANFGIAYLFQLITFHDYLGSEYISYILPYYFLFGSLNKSALLDYLV